jgi:hypothetical protein
VIGFEHYSPFPAISISTLTAFARCPRKFFYSFGVGIGKEEHIALKFGEAIHAALPHAFFADLVASFAAFDHVWEDRDSFADEKRNKMSARLILTDYMQSHASNRSIYKLLKPPSTTLRLSKSISEYEIPFVLDIGLSIPLVGRIDAHSSHRDTGELWLNEFKTSSEMSTRFFDGFQLNPQVVGYTLGARAHGIPVKGCIVEGLKVSSAKKDAQMTQSTPVFVTDQMVEDFLIWAKYTAFFMLACQDAKEFPKDISACTPYSQFGMPGYQCEYLPMCLTSDWTSMKGMYTPKDYPTFRLLNGPKLKPALTEVTTNGLPIHPAQPPLNPSRTIRIGAAQGAGPVVASTAANDPQSTQQPMQSPP